MHLSIQFEVYFDRKIKNAFTEVYNWIYLSSDTSRLLHKSGYTDTFRGKYG